MFKNINLHKNNFIIIISDKKLLLIERLNDDMTKINLLVLDDNLLELLELELLTGFRERIWRDWVMGNGGEFLDFGYFGDGFWVLGGG